MCIHSSYKLNKQTREFLDDRKVEICTIEP
jgi:hypothetical protein